MNQLPARVDARPLTLASGVPVGRDYLLLLATGLLSCAASAADSGASTALPAFTSPSRLAVVVSPDTGAIDVPMTSADRASVSFHETRLGQLAVSNQGAQIVRIVREQLISPDTPAREAILREAALALGQVDELADGRTVLESLVAYQARTMSWLEEGPHRIAIARYDVAAAARYSLARWDRAKQRHGTMVALLLGDPNALAQPPSSLPGTRAASAPEGVLAAIEQAPLDLLQAQRAYLLSALTERRSTRPFAARAALACATRLHDLPLYLAALDAADSPTALQAVRQATVALTAHEALEVLRQATHRADVGSAALYAMAALRGQVHSADSELIAALDRPVLRSTAVSAIAAQTDPDLTAKLIDWVMRQQDPKALAIGLTGVRLLGDAHLRATQLQRLRQAALTSAPLRKALHQTELQQ